MSDQKEKDALGLPWHLQHDWIIGTDQRDVADIYDRRRDEPEFIVRACNEYHDLIRRIEEKVGE